jgi:all-trans-8'-apo-beta-carotenal 15,15'-oxygenase
MHGEAYESWVRGLRPVVEEQSSLARCVRGALPEELVGTLYRCGPSQRILPPQGQAGLHLFDGDGLVQRFRFESGQVVHTSRFVRTASFVAEQRSGTFNQDCLGTRADLPLRTIPMRQQQNTNVVAHAGRLLALVESAAPIEIAPDTLRRLGERTFGLELAGRPLSAHPKIDRRTGEMFIHGCYPLQPYLQVHCVGCAGTALWSRGIELPAPTWVHDVALTERYVVVPLSPVAIDVAREQGRWIPTDPYASRPGERLRWLVCGREDGRVHAQIESESDELVLHIGAAFDDGAAIVVDAVSYADPAAYLAWLKVARAGQWIPNSQARYVRYRLNLEQQTADATVLVERASEFPHVDERALAARPRYTYLALGELPAGAAAPSPWNRIGRLDCQTGTLEEHVLPPYVWAGEPIFAPRDAHAAEGDGFVLVLAYDGLNDRSVLLVLDARRLSAPPIATLALDGRVPFGFHGTFVAHDSRALA